MAYLNQTYINNLTAQINSIPNCQALQDLVNNEIKVYFTNLLADIRTDIANLLPLISIPSSLDDVISWITHSISLINNQYIKLIALEAEIISTYTNLLSTIEAKISSLSCSFTPPNPLN